MLNASKTLQSAWTIQHGARMFRDPGRAPILAVNFRLEVGNFAVLAHQFGGGGHAAAAGFAIADAKRAPAERLAEILGDRLERDS